MLLLNEIFKTDPALHIQPETIGKVLSTRGGVIIASLPKAQLGELCALELADKRRILCEVIAFQHNQFILAPFENIQGLSPQAKVIFLGRPGMPKVSNNLFGCVLDALGKPLSTGGFKFCSYNQSEGSHETDFSTRAIIDRILCSGVRALDAFCTLGYGQRIGLFASAGLGKSTLLGMIARNAKVDVSVIALIGERGREVQEFIEQSLGAEGLKKSVLVVSTSDESAVRRKWALQTACSIAEEYREQGLNVLLLVDSITRLARALREIGLASGELPVRQGFPASVYAELPKILERAGKTQNGSITAIYSVLTNPLQEEDPLADELKSLLDGHVVLNPELFRLGIRPAIDPCLSISRLSQRLNSNPAQENIAAITRAFARLSKDKDLIMLGGTPDPELRAAIHAEKELQALLSQDPTGVSSFEHTLHACSVLAQKIKSLASAFASNAD